MSSTESESNNEDSSKKSNFRLILLIAIIAAVVVVVVVVVVVLVVVLTKDDDDDDESSSGSTVTVTISNGSSSASVSYGYANLVTADTSYTETATFSSTTADQVVFLVTAGTLTLDGSASGVTIKVTKSGDGSSSASRVNQGTPPGGGDSSGGGGGTTSSSDSYSFYGTNSAIVIAGESAKGVLTSITISTSSTYSNAVVCTSQGSVTVTSCTIITTGSSNSRGLHATYAGTITATGTSITTSGGSCASLATDRGGGTVTASSMTLSTAGTGSPLIYSTGTITVTGSTGTASGAQICVVEGKNQVTLTNCQFSASGTGNRQGTSTTLTSTTVIDRCGIMIYQSNSGDSSQGNSGFTATGCTFTLDSSATNYSTTPFIFTTTTTAVITMSDCDCSFNTDYYFIKSESTDAWTGGASNVTYTLSSLKFGGSTPSTVYAYKESGSTWTEGDDNAVTLTFQTLSEQSHRNKSEEEEE